MNWQLAIEKNREALKRILAMLVAMAGMTGSAADERSASLPRHLHRFMLRLLRPAEAATRRLIIVAARGLAVDITLPRTRKPRPKAEPRTILVLDRVNGSIVSVPIVLPDPTPEIVRSRPARRQLSLPLLDPLTRFGTRRRYAKAAIMPRIWSLDDTHGPRRPDSPLPVSPAADDLLDAGRLHRRLDAIGRALDDLPGQAIRLARWQARCAAVLAKQRDDRAAGTVADTPVAVDAIRKPRFTRSSPMRPGRPPGWRRRPNHDVDDVLNELHGLAVWARERPDTS